MKLIKTNVKDDMFVHFKCPNCSSATLRKYFNSMELSFQDIKCVYCGTEFTASIDRTQLKKTMEKIPAKIGFERNE